MKTLSLFFIFIIVFMLDAAAQSKDSLIIMIDKNFKKTKVISYNNKSLSVRINKHTYIGAAYRIKNWGTDSFSVFYKKDEFIPKCGRIEKDSAKFSKDTLFNVAYTDITGIRVTKRKGSVVEFILFPITLIILAEGIFNDDPGAIIFTGVIVGIFTLQAIISPYEKTYRFNKKWNLVSIAGHHMD